MTTELTSLEKQFLLRTARDMITSALVGDSPPSLNIQELSAPLREPGACFVTLTRGGELRGCVGSIEATKPLVEDVRERSLAAAFKDPRFPPLQVDELDQIQIEISTLTKPEVLDYVSPEDLVNSLRPGIDGVILSLGFRRATFLPQVWQKLPEPEQFLGRLCLKMGLPQDTWMNTQLEVQVYQVEEFSEGE